MASCSSFSNIRGAAKLTDGKYSYVYHKTYTNGEAVWRCSRYRYGECKAVVKTPGKESHDIIGNVEKIAGLHSCAMEPANVEYEQFRGRVRKRARETTEPTAQIVSDALTGISEEAQTSISQENAKRLCRFARQVVNGPAPTPATLADIRIPPERTTFDFGSGQENILKWDSGPDDNERILIFATQRTLDELQQATEIASDGTFDATPRLFTQVYTIHARRFGETLPLVYCLLPNKSQATYDRLFAQLCLLCNQLLPRTLICDFEKAVINCAQAHFPNIDVVGCFFHFSQSFWRHLNDSGLRNVYIADREFRLLSRCVPALAFIPSVHVPRAFEHLSTYIQQNFDGANYTLLQAVLDSFEDTYVGRPTHNGRRAATYPVELWNEFYRVMASEARTNNAVEGYHRGIVASLSVDNPTIWKFIRFLETDIRSKKQTILSLQGGANPRPQRKIYQRRDLRFLNKAMQWDQSWVQPIAGWDAPLLKYLRAFAYQNPFIGNGLPQYEERNN